MVRSAAVVLAALFVIVVAACSDPGINEECDKEGATDGVCRENLVCGRYRKGEGFVCLRRCTLPGECSSTETCVTIPNSNGIQGCESR